MDIAEGSELERLGVVVIGEGIEETKAQLLSLGEAGEASAAKAGRSASAGATAFAQSFSEGARTAQAAMRTTADAHQEVLARHAATANRLAQESAAAAQRFSQSALSQLQGAAQATGPIGAEAARDYAAGLKQEFATVQAGIREAVARGLLTTQEARKAGLDAARAYNTAILGAIDRGQAAGAFNGPQGTQAYTALAGTLKNVEEQSTRTGVSMNTLRAGFTSLLSSALQTAPGVAQLSSSIGAMALGTGVTVGVLAAIAAITAGYNALTAETRKAREERDRDIESLDRWYQRQQDGDTGAFERQIAAKIAQMKEFRATLDDLTNRRPTANLGEFASVLTQTLLSTATSFNPATIGDEFERRWNDVVARQKAAITKGAAEVAAAGRAAYEASIRESYDAAAKQGGDLASLIGARRATSAQGSDAATLLDKERAALAELQRAYGTLTDAKARAFNLDLQSRALAGITQLEDAYRNASLARLKDIQAEQSASSDAANAYIAANQRVLDSIAKQADAIRDGAAANADSLRQAEQAAALARTEGTAREYLTNQFKAENAAIEANRSLTGIALRERLETIEAIRRQANETTRLTELQRQIGEATGRAAQNTKAAQDALRAGADLYERSNAEAAKLSNTLERDLVRSIAHVATTGTQSFRAFADAVEQGAVRMTSALEQSIARQKELLDQANKKNLDADAQVIKQRIAGLEAMQRVTEGLSAGIAGGFAGYGIGQFIGANGGSAGGGFVAGAATGALAGSAFGPLGAAVGGLAGAAGGLLGAASAHKEAVQQFREAIKAWQDSSQKFILASQGSTVGAQIIDIRAQGEALKKNADLLAAALHLAGSGGLGSPTADALAGPYKDQAAALKAAIDAAIKRVEKDFFGSITEQLNALNGPAGEYANKLAAIDQAYAQNVANVNALAETLHYTAEQSAAAQAQVKALADAQRAAAEAAYKEQQRRQQEDFSIRGLGASGASTRAIENAQFDIGQRREIADLQAQNAPKELLDQVLALQDAERKRRDADFAAIQQQAQEDYRVRQLAAEGHSAEAAALRLQLDQEREYQAAVKAGLDDATLAALALAQAAESASAAAKQAQEAQRALDDLQVRALTAQGDTGAADQLRFQLQQQREIEDAITAGRSQEYLDRLKEVQRLEADARAQGQQTANNTVTARQTGATEAVSYAARNLSEITGNRMADYLASILIVERQQLDIMRGHTGTPGGVPFFAQPLGYNENRGVQPASVAGIDVNALAQAIASRGAAPRTASPDTTPIRVLLEHRVIAGTGRLDLSKIDEDIDELAEKLEAALIRRANLQRLADGSPLLSGA